MSALQAAYTGSYTYEGGGNIYVHLHSENIGMAENENGEPIRPSQVTSIFQSRKKQALQASKRQFTNLFFKSLDENSIRLLKQVFNSGNQDQIMTQVQRQMGKQIQESLNIEKIQQLVNLEKSRNVNVLSKEIVNNKSIQAYNDLISLLEQAMKIVGSQEGSFLSLALLQNPPSIQAGGKRLLKALNDFKKNNEGKEIKSKEIEKVNHIIDFVLPLGKRLIDIGTQRRGSKDFFTADALKKLIQGIFSTGFAEVLAGNITELATQTIMKNVETVFSGQQGVEISFTDQHGNFVRTGGTKSAGKADVKLKNVSLSLQNILGEDQGSITVEVGISNKFYITQNFHDLNGKKLTTGTFGSGSGGSLTEALLTTFGDNLRYLYYSYNILSHADKEMWKTPNRALNDILLTRQIVRLFASRGGSADFAQFMLVNGKIIPIWDIILSTIQNVGYSSNEEGHNNQAVYLSIPDRPEIMEAAQQREDKLEQRIINVNQKISKAKIYAHLNLAKLQTI